MTCNASCPTTVCELHPRRHRSQPFTLLGYLYPSGCSSPQCQNMLWHTGAGLFQLRCYYPLATHPALLCLAVISELDPLGTRSIRSGQPWRPYIAKAMLRLQGPLFLYFAKLMTNLPFLSGFRSSSIILPISSSL